MLSKFITGMAGFLLLTGSLSAETGISFSLQSSSADFINIADPEVNLLESGNMETDSWTANAGNTDISLSYQDGQVPEGSRALKVVTGNMGGDVYYEINSDERFHLEQYSRITISFMAKSDIPGLELQAGISEEGSAGRQSFGMADLSSEWEIYHFSVVLNKQTSDNYLFSFRGFGVGTIYIDNLQVGTGLFADIPQSEIYDVSIINTQGNELINVFRSECPVYSPGYQGMLEKYKKPFSIFKGRTISWAKFMVGEPVTLKVVINNTSKVPIDGRTVKIFPSRYGITPEINGNEIVFTITEPAQYSVEVGEKGYENGLVLFADPPEEDIPNPADANILALEKASSGDITSVPDNYNTLYFKKGIHDIGVYHVPSNIKNVYFEDGSWVYGALIMDGNPDVRIYGRGILSQARLNYRESHGVEAINGSDRIKLEGLVIADYKFFSVRLIGEFNEVDFVKVIGGWAWHCDGIAAYKGSRVSNCFIWANDDAIKVYRDSITWNDIVVWQLDNGGIIQMSWGGAVGGSTSRGVRLSRIDILHCEYDTPGFNTALLSCIGNRRAEEGKSDWIEDWVIEDVVTETPVQIVFGITPDSSTPLSIHGLTLKNWNVKMPLNTNYTNSIVANYPNDFYDEIVMDNVVFNGQLLTDVNYLTRGDMENEGWSAEGGSTNQSVHFEENSGISQSKGLKSLVTNMGEDNSYLISCNENFQFVRNGKLNLSFWAKANIINTRLTPVIVNINTNDVIEFDDVLLSGEWTKYELSVTANPDMTADYRFKFRAYGLNTVIFLDDVQLGHPDWRKQTEMVTQYLHPPLILPEIPVVHSPLTSISTIPDSKNIYPNPAHDELYIKNADSFTSYEIINSRGVTEMKSYGSTVQLSSLAPGLYIIITGDGRKMKFIKK